MTSKDTKADLTMGVTFTETGAAKSKRKIYITENFPQHLKGGEKKE